MDSKQAEQQKAVKKAMINRTTNGVAVAGGIPQLVQGIALLVAGDYVNGATLTLQGISWLVGFYLVGK